MPGRRHLARSLMLVSIAALSLSCFSARYVAQAARGQLGILRAARPIGDVLADAEVPGRTRRLLAAVATIKRFGGEQGLQPTRSYDRYAELCRPAAVWVVQACAPLSFDVRRWSFPIVGSIPYLGFFDEARAHGYAEELRQREHVDVDVRTASAFSTLGWFHDPILSTMIVKGDEALGELANVVLHESVHATLYVKDQSAFNESLASFVADRLTPAWLERALGRDAPETRAWAAAHARERAHVERMHRAYLELDAVYRSTLPDPEKLAAKRRILADVERELKLRRPLNNAALAGFKTYDTGMASFERLLAACDGSFPRLLGAVATLGPDAFGSPQREAFDDVIERLARDGCGARRAPDLVADGRPAGPATARGPGAASAAPATPR